MTVHISAVGDPVPDEFDPFGPGRDNGIGIGLKQFGEFCTETMEQKSLQQRTGSAGMIISAIIDSWWSPETWQ